MGIIERFRTLPGKTRSLLSISIIFALVVALPLFIWAIVNLNFNPFKKASTGEPLPSPSGPQCPGAEACPASAQLLRNCHPPEGDNSPQESLCGSGFAGRVEFCGSSYYCCNGTSWSTNMSSCPTFSPAPTPTPSPMPTATPTPSSPPLMTSQPTAMATATSVSTPQPSRKPLSFRVKFDGVNDESAEGAKATIRFVSGFINVLTPPVSFRYAGNGVYETLISPFGFYLPFMGAGNGYTIYVKGEKHISNKFCRPLGQVGPCVGGGNILVPEVTAEPFSLYDFTGYPLQPGDLPPQNGVANGDDFARLKALLTKPCSELTIAEKNTGDLDYNGCVNVRDAFLMRKTLESRYDEY